MRILYLHTICSNRFVLRKVFSDPFRDLAGRHTFKANRATFNNMIASGSINIVSNEDLQNKLGVYVVGINTTYPKIKPHLWIGMDWPECYDRKLWNEPFMKIARGGRSEKMFVGDKLVKYYHL